MLLCEPLRKPLLDFFVWHDAAGVNVVESLLDLLADVNVVLDFLQRRVLGEFLEYLLNLLLRGLHRSILRRAVTDQCLALRRRGFRETSTTNCALREPLVAVIVAWP